MPRYATRLGYQNEPWAVSRVVIESREVRQSECVCAIGDAPRVAAPHIGIRDRMTAPRSPVANARDTSFRAVHGNEYQVDLVSSGFGLTQEIHSPPAGQGCLDSETRTLIEVSRRAAENLSGGGNRYSGRIPR